MATKADIDRWIASQGGPDAVSHGYEDIETPDPLGVTSHPDYDRDRKGAKITTRRETWTNKTTGATYSATRTPGANDQFEDIKETPGTKAATPAATAKPVGGSETIEGTPDSSKQSGFDNDRPRKVIRDASGKEIWSGPLSKTEMDEWRESRERSRNPGGKSDAQIAQEQKDAQATAERNRPGAPTLKPDGKGGTIAVQTMPDGSIKTTPLPGVPSDATRITVDGVVYEKGPDGAFAPAKGIPLPGATAKNIDAWAPDYTQPDLGFAAWANKQRAKIGTPAEAGGITQSEYDSAVKSTHDQASVTIQNVTSNQTVRRQQEQDERSQRKDLSAEAAGDYTRAQSQFQQNLRYMNPDKPGIGTYVDSIMAEQARHRQQREGTARTPVPLHPMFQALPAAAGVTMAPGAVPGAAPSGPTPPNALGLGAIGNTAAPTAAPAVAGPVEAAPIIQPTVNAPDPSTNWAPSQENEINPNAVGMASPTEGPVSAWAQPLVAPQQAGVGQPVLPDLQQAQQPVFDPIEVGGRLANLGVPQDAIAQAMLELGMVG